MNYIASQVFWEKTANGSTPPRGGGRNSTKQQKGSRKHHHLHKRGREQHHPKEGKADNTTQKTEAREAFPPERRRGINITTPVTSTSRYLTLLHVGFFTHVVFDHFRHSLPLVISFCFVHQFSFIHFSFLEKLKNLARGGPKHLNIFEFIVTNSSIQIFKCSGPTLWSPRHPRKQIHEKQLTKKTWRKNMTWTKKSPKEKKHWTENQPKKNPIMEQNKNEMTKIMMNEKKENKSAKQIQNTITKKNKKFNICTCFFSFILRCFHFHFSWSWSIWPDKEAQNTWILECVIFSFRAPTLEPKTSTKKKKNEKKKNRKKKDWCKTYPKKNHETRKLEKRKNNHENRKITTNNWEKNKNTRINLENKNTEKKKWRKKKNSKRKNLEIHNKPGKTRTMPLPSHGRSASLKQREISLSVLRTLRQNRSYRRMCPTNFNELWINLKTSNESYETCWRLCILPSEMASWEQMCVLRGNYKNRAFRSTKHVGT